MRKRTLRPTKSKERDLAARQWSPLCIRQFVQRQINHIDYCPNAKAANRDQLQDAEASVAEVETVYTQASQKQAKQNRS